MNDTPQLPTWPTAVARSLLAVGLLLPAALVLNVLIGRMIHWDIVAQSPRSRS